MNQGIEYLDWREIKIGKRQRKDLPEKHVQELANSIISVGLIHALTIDKDNFLVAGECRYRALQSLYENNKTVKYAGQAVPLGLIPVANTHLMTEDKIFELELEENLRRKNLSPVEQAQAIAQLHKFRQKENPQQTQKATAEELLDLGIAQTKSHSEREVAEALLLDQFADDPDVQKARTKGSAVRIAKRKIEQNIREAFGSGAETPTGLGVLHHGDSLSLLRTLNDEDFDGILTDPPYGIDADGFGEAAFMGKSHQYDDTPEYAFRALEVLANEGFRVCKPEAHIYVFCDIVRFERLREIFTDAGWDVWKTPLIWYKGATAHAPKPDYGPKRTYEAILFANKGDKRILRCRPDVIIYNSVFRDSKLHAAEKPKELLGELLSWSFHPGSTILDPFCGSGSIFPAAKTAGIHATGVEIDEKYYNIAKGRLAEGASE